MPLISSFTVLSDNIYGKNLILKTKLYFNSFVFTEVCFFGQYTWQKVLWNCQKYVCSAVAGWKYCNILRKSICFKVWFNSDISMLMFFFSYLSVVEVHWGLQLQLFWCFIWPSMSNSACSMELGVPLLGTYVCNCYLFLLNRSHKPHIESFFDSPDQVWLTVYCVWKQDSISCLWVITAWNIIFHPLIF